MIPGSAISSASRNIVRPGPMSITSCVPPVPMTTSYGKAKPRTVSQFTVRGLFYTARSYTSLYRICKPERHIDPPDPGKEPFIAKLPRVRSRPEGETIRFCDLPRCEPKPHLNRIQGSD